MQLHFGPFEVVDAGGRPKPPHDTATRITQGACFGPYATNAVLDPELLLSRVSLRELRMCNS